MNVQKYDEKEFTQQNSDIFLRQGEGFADIVKVIADNKDLITNVAKATASLGSTTKSIADAVKSSNELQQVKEIAAIREQALKRQKRPLSEEMKRRIQQI